MKRLFLLLLLCASSVLAQDLRPSAYLGLPGKITVRGGKILGTAGGVTTIAEQTLTPANSATTYVYIDLSGTPAVATSTSAFPASSYFPICIVTKDANGVITAFTDSRPDSFMAGGGGVSPNSPFPFADIPGEPGVSTVPVRTGLMAEYRILPTETPASLVDYSGNGRNATGTIGTTPTIIATTGGIQCNANGGVVLPSSVNAALDVFIYIGFQSKFAPNGGSQTFYSLLQGNGNGTTTN